SSGAARTSCGTVRFPLFTENFTRTWSIRLAQIVSTAFAFVAPTRRPADSIAVTAIRVSPKSSSSPIATSSSGENSRDVFSERSGQDRMRGTTIGFGSRVTTFEIASHFEHLTTPSKTISYFPAIVPQRVLRGKIAGKDEI